MDPTKAQGLTVVLIRVAKLHDGDPEIAGAILRLLQNVEQAPSTTTRSLRELRVVPPPPLR